MEKNKIWARLGLVIFIGSVCSVDMAAPLIERLFNGIVGVLGATTFVIAESKIYEK